MQAVAVFKVGAEQAGPVAEPAWDGKAERRGPDRARNVARIARPAAKESKKVVNSDEWTEF